PLALAVSGTHHVFATSEFHRGAFTDYDITGATISLHTIPMPVDPGPFAQQNGTRTQTSILGEDIVVDTHDRVWLTEGGANFYSGASPNHSRIVMFDPATSQVRVYSVPRDHDQVYGVAWDASRGRIWFTQTGGNGAALWSFDPERTFYDTSSPTFDFSSSLEALVNGADP